MAFPDRGYTNLLAHLNRSSSSLALPTIQSSISYYLAHQTSLPTPLAATVSSSLLFLPFSFVKLDLLTTAFRHALHLKFQLLQEQKPGGLFSHGLKTLLNQWTAAIVDGVASSRQPTIRLACLGGLLLALNADLKSKNLTGISAVDRIENEILVALAEVIDTYSYVRSPEAWENEFHATEDGEVDALSLAFILASQSLPFVPDAKLSAIPLLTLSRLLSFVIDTTFRSGKFLAGLSAATTHSSEYKVYIPTDSQFATDLNVMSNSPLLTTLGSLSKLFARSLALLLEKRPKEGMQALSETLSGLKALTASVETDWSSSTLSGIIDEAEIEPTTREITKTIWAMLKALLFSTVMITDVALSAVLFVPRPQVPSPADVALTTLHIMAHLAFVISQFGGVTVMGDGGFAELRKAFYVALDILSGDGKKSGRFVQDECEAFQNIRDTDHPLQQAKMAYVLASIEQLVPVLDAECIQSYVFPLCLPHLNDYKHRETYESAHSVILAILSSHAQNEENYQQRDRKGKHRQNDLLNAERLLPFYTNCLIENSIPDRLTTVQLQLAFSALSRAAISNPTLEQFCINALISAISTTTSEEHRHKLLLALISCVPSVSLTILPRVLEEVKVLLGAENDTDKRSELVQVLWKEMESVGDLEREIVMRWWVGLREVLVKVEEKGLTARL